MAPFLESSYINQDNMAATEQADEKPTPETPTAVDHPYRSSSPPSSSTLSPPSLFVPTSNMTAFGRVSESRFGRPSDAVQSSSGTLHPRQPTTVGLTFGRDFCGDTLMLHLGPGKTVFQVHRQLLTEASQYFCGKFNNPFSDACAHLEDDDPDAFGLLLDWLYRGEMASLRSLTILGGPSAQQPGSLFPSELGAATQLPDTTPGLTVKFMHIGAKDMYVSLSPEEVKFIETHSTEGENALNYVKYLKQGIRDDTIRPQSVVKPEAFEIVSQVGSKTTKKLRALRLHLEEAEQVPITLQFPGHIEAEFLQLTLLKLIIMAERYCWENLFNAAMASYREGEERLRRRHPVLRHIELTYRSCSRQSALVTLMADYAFLAAKSSGSQSAFLELFGQYPDFLHDIMERHDRHAKHPGSIGVSKEGQWSISTDASLYRYGSRSSKSS